MALRAGIVGGVSCRQMNVAIQRLDLLAKRYVGILRAVLLGIIVVMVHALGSQLLLENGKCDLEHLPAIGLFEGGLSKPLTSSIPIRESLISILVVGQS